MIKIHLIEYKLGEKKSNNGIKNEIILKFASYFLVFDQHK